MFTTLSRRFSVRVSTRTFSTSSWSREAEFSAGVQIPLTTELSLDVPDTSKRRAAYRILDEDGRICPVLNQEPDVKVNEAQQLYKNMVRLQVMDQVLYEAQRQGRISFYMTTSGEEAINIGSASGLELKDTVFAQYREAGVLLWRGFTLQNFVDQCFSNVDDPGKGRQMPIHYGSKKLNFHTISSPLTTQVPQAVGAAYAAKSSGDESIAVTYFGEGAASEGDFHPALNFAATLDCPVLFFCRNNGYAISTPVKDQYAGDGIVSRAEGYGIASVRVDGNDVLAVQKVTKLARAYALKHNKPVLVEAMSYRQGHHSTSDDSTTYREIEEIEHWKQGCHPITRFRKFMEDRSWWNDDLEKELRASERKLILEAVREGEDKGKSQSLDNLFEDVYSDIPPHLLEQQRELEYHLSIYPDEYHLDDH
mmetsp:Transcript_10356/g.11891  ORF Transcript_10356/g.11891 Transcript_10356/m.11891 type:complete len:422 (+) Transcript_10356:236-1501(+)